jgi:LmbE family N-acetylglucosaminyl deacetylase
LGAMGFRRRLAVLLVCLASVAALASAAPSLQPLDLDRGATGLGLALRHLGVTGRVLYVTAHPDDEHNGVLVRLSRGLGLRTALLTLTRGEGGQNVIGPELFEALGVLRTGELMALHRYDAAEQYFGRAYEFGFSFSVEETFEKWGHEDTLGDVVRVVRAFRPDVILTLPLEGDGGGQHHQAAARLAAEAFRAAADPSRFPDQVREGLRPWQALKIYQGGVGGFGEVPGVPVHVPTGVYDPLLGMTWQQLGSRERAMHRCQGARQLVADPGPAEGVYSLVDSEPKVASAETDVLDGFDPSLRGLVRFSPSSPALASELDLLQRKTDAARAAFDPLAPQKAVPALADALTAIRAALAGLDGTVGSAPGRAEVEGRLRDEEADAVAALALAQGLTLEARADDGLVTPGEPFGVAVSLWNASGKPVEADAVELQVPPGWSVERKDGAPGTVAAGGSRQVRFVVTAAPDARLSQPYWQRAKDRDRNVLLVPQDETLPWDPPRVTARVECRIGGVEAALSSPAVWRYAGPFVGGEKRYEVQVVPDLSVRVSPEIGVVELGAPQRPLEVHAFVRSFAKGAGEAGLRLEAPAGWSVEPAGATLHFGYEGEEAGARFRVTPPARVAAGTFALRAVATRGGREYSEGVEEVAYDHIERRQLMRPAETRLLALDVRTLPGASVGYVMGSGDALADAVRELGVPVTLLDADALAFSDLSRFTTIVTGIRAYETRPDLRSSQGRLMRWVEAGGHLVVMYNRAAFNRVSPDAPSVANESSPFCPWPAAVTSERITDETAPMRVLDTAHPLLSTPNRIGPSDWDGWVQERGIQFLDARDARYEQLLAATDPFPYNPGEKRGILVDTKVGRGTWTYVGLVLFREVPAGVPGGWRLLANLVSRPRGR